MQESKTQRVEAAVKLEWYVFRVRPRHEKVVASQLSEKEQHYFLPLLKEKRRWGKRTAQVETPLFPGYVFCEAERYELLPILKTPGVVDVVRVGTSPAPVNKDEVLAIKRVIDLNAKIEPCNFLSVGQKVKIVDGPFVGLSGCLIDVRNAKRLVLSISLLQRSVCVEVDEAVILPLDQPFVLSEFLPCEETPKTPFFNRR